MKKGLFSYAWLLCFMICATSAYAQTNYTWDEYNLVFTVPAGFRETASTDDKFEGEAPAAKIELFAIYPLKDRKLTKDNLAEALIDLIESVGMIVDEKDEIDFNGFEGYYVRGTVEKKKTFVAVMQDPKGTLNFTVTIVHNNVDAGVKILQSIRKR